MVTNLAHDASQALQQLRTRLSKSGDVPAEDTLQWFLRDRYSS
jgi:hypothetical protein